jgi:hypothetical protein
VGLSARGGEDLAVDALMRAGHRVGLAVDDRFVASEAVTAPAMSMR